MLTASRAICHALSPPRSRGFTLAELIVAVALSGLAFGGFAMIAARQERTYAELTRRARERSQWSEGIAALATELRAVAPRAGDIPPGGARDSAIEFRATVGSLAICELRGQTIVAGLASFVTAPEAGDTAWGYIGADTDPPWAPLAVVGVSSVPISHPVECTAPGRASNVFTSRRPPPHRYALTIAQPAPAGISVGAPVRVTRHVRYSVYRGPDGRWYLGRREWSAIRGRFETIQPVSGPYAAYAALRYFDESGIELPTGTGATDRIAKIDLAFREPREAREVISVTVGLRNR